MTLTASSATTPEPGFFAELDRRRSVASIWKASARRSRISTVAAYRRRSRELTYVRSMPALSAKSSCDHPRSARSLTKFSARAVRNRMPCVWDHCGANNHGVYSTGPLWFSVQLRTRERGHVRMYLRHEGLRHATHQRGRFAR